MSRNKLNIFSILYKLNKYLVDIKNKKRIIVLVIDWRQSISYKLKD